MENYALANVQMRCIRTRANARDKNPPIGAEPKTSKRAEQTNTELTSGPLIFPDFERNLAHPDRLPSGPTSLSNRA